MTENKVQLIAMICTYLRENPSLITSSKKLTVTGPDPVPFEIASGIVIQRGGLTNHHEETDVIVVNQAVNAAKGGASSIKVVADDTDVFVLLVYFYWKEQLTNNVVMSSTSSRRMIDVKETVAKHKKIIPDIVAAHSLSGCDSVSVMHGNGKGTALKVLRAGHQLKVIGQQNASLTSVFTEAFNFVAACYGYPKEDNINALRFTVWSAKWQTAS